MARQHHILIVEDEERWREHIFRETLEDSGYQVKTSSSYGEAITALGQQAFDLAVIDVNLTGLSGNRDGVRVLEYVASMKPRPLAVVVSGSKTWAAAEKSARKFRPIAFLDKTTFDVAEFIALVRGALATPPG